MDCYAKMLSRLNHSPAIERLSGLYGHGEGRLSHQLSRYTRLIKQHEELYHAEQKPLYLISAPGRTEIIGNHTDHNNGRVLAAAVNLDCLACVTPRDDLMVRLESEGYPTIALSLEELSARPEEEGTSSALIRGVAKGMADHGFRLGGFDACVTSDAMGGSGLSSSAAYEVMICAVIDALYNGFSMNSTLRAQIAQYAENVYFGKPSGLMDQMACSTGGLVTIDFRDTQHPQVTPLSFSFEQAGYSLVVVNTGGSHDNLTAEYAAIRTEMESVAAYFGEKTLRQVRPEQIVHSLSDLRGQVGDRAILRAFHFMNENQRVKQIVQDIQRRDIDAILSQINASGQSSMELLQNVFCPGSVQPMTLALTLAQMVLDGRGACRVHGGGFAGTTLNVVPLDRVSAFIRQMEAVFGPHSCITLDVRPEGAAVVAGK